MPKLTKKALTDFWYENYSSKGHCGLCGNHGRIDTRGIKTPAGFECGGIFPCICPNGQAIRRALARAALAQEKEGGRHG